MKNSPRKKAPLLIVLLALVCICSVELAVCRYYDPALYHTITDPVVNAAAKAADAVGSTVTNAAAAVHDRVSDAIREARERRAAAELEKALLEARKQESSASENDAPFDNTDVANLSSITDDQTATLPLLASSGTICDPAVTQLDTIDGQEILTGGIVNVVYYNQGDPLWGDLKYGTDKISSHGCGPTAMAMVVDSLSDTATDPYTMSQWAASNGYWARRSGSYHSIVIGTATAFGLAAETFSSREITPLQDALLSGKLLVALMGPGHFTQSGHFIVLRGVTLSGEILVADPSSLERSLTAWDAQLILDELSKSTAGGGPLWIISPPQLSFS